MLKRIFRANQLPRQDWLRTVLSALRVLPAASHCQSLSTYRLDSTLGNHLDLVFTVKHQQQRALNRIMRDRLRGGRSMKVLGGRAPRPYRDGLLVQHALRNGHSEQMHVREPFGLDRYGMRLAVAAGNEIRLYDTCEQVTHVYRNPWFAQLHSVYFSNDGSRLLVVSTGFDTVLEFNVADCELTMAWNAWDHGYDVSPSGIKVRRGCKPFGEQDPHSVVVDDPGAWKGFGLPTGLTAAHLNNARYRDNDGFMITLFHHGRALLVTREGKSREILGGLLNPHGFEPGWQGEHLVTDTRRGQVIFFDDTFQVKRVVVMDACPPVETRAGLEEWLQNVLHLEGGLYAAIDIHRSCMWLFEPSTQRYRQLKFSPDWAVQNVIAVPPQHVKSLSRRLDDYTEIVHQISDPRGLMRVADTRRRSVVETMEEPA